MAKQVKLLEDMAIDTSAYHEPLHGLGASAIVIHREIFERLTKIPEAKVTKARVQRDSKSKGPPFVAPKAKNRFFTDVVSDDVDDPAANAGISKLERNL